ncbi:lipopolysaccharide biosynthesis [Phormidium sp. LEGE 05292]|uniref:GumC family protein n=1 Tax=[Phormidium] sp. LEGE 05292 TaxID=767427 RepID=UPI00187E8272|nr:tyrosine-protein kinase domain-containing protein [Phormidium sp. LEGE 05292]MBE9227509.1 lipopolysaccharide biosynthesis [Phormidium sp. LEGE 05292]
MTLPIVKRYLIAFSQHKWTGLAACVLVTGVSVIVAKQPAPPTEYQAEGGLIANPPTVVFSKTATDIQQPVPSLKLIKNNDVITSVAQQAKVEVKELVKKLNISLPKPAAKGEAAPALRITVKYTDTDKKRAENVVNAVLQESSKFSRKINTVRLTAIMNEINKRLPLVEKELREAERNLEQYTKREGSVLLAAKNGSLVQSILASQGQQSAVILQLQGIETQIASLQQRLGLNPDQAYASSALSADPIIANLRVQIYQAESQLEILKKDLRPKHPNIIQLQKQIQSYEELLRQRANEVIGGNGMVAPLKSANEVRQDSNLDPARQSLANQLVALQTQKETLQQQLKGLMQQEQKLRKEYATIPNKQLGQARLQEKLQLKQNVYSQMQASLADAQTAEAETVSTWIPEGEAQVIKLAPEAMSPIIIIAAGGLVGIVIGGAIIFLLGSLGGVFQTMEDIRAAMVQRDIAVLGILPYVAIADPELGETPIILDPHSPYLEPYERLRTNLRRATENPVKVILLTSVTNEEGKSVSAYNLAITSARAGKRTLIVEADMRSPSLARSVKVAPDPDASIEPLRYYGNWSDCIRLVPEVENLYLVPTPGPIQQPAAILESSEFRRLLEDVRGRFDMVFVDAPALSLCNDTFVLEPMTDGIILVARPGYTVESMFSEAAEQLTESEDIRFLGGIINGTDIPIAKTLLFTEQQLMVPEPESETFTEKEEQQPEEVKVPTN